jgi:hypothetical protein
MTNNGNSIKFITSCDEKCVHKVHCFYHKENTPIPTKESNQYALPVFWYPPGIGAFMDHETGETHNYTCYSYVSSQRQNQDIDEQIKIIDSSLKEALSKNLFDPEQMKMAEEKMEELNKQFCEKVMEDIRENPLPPEMVDLGNRILANAPFIPEKMIPLLNPGFIEDKYFPGTELHVKKYDRGMNHYLYQLLVKDRIIHVSSSILEITAFVAGWILRGNYEKEQKDE